MLRGSNQGFGRESMTPKITAIAPWFGSNRMLAEYVGYHLKDCRWVGIPFAGGMSELVYIDAPTIVVNDLHRHIMNLACFVADERASASLAEHLMNMPFHPDVLKYAQRYCEKMERGGFDFEKHDTNLSEEWALNYFIASWMGRSGKAGTDNEFSGGISARWNANGGDSNTRYRSAVESIKEWQKIMQRCNFTTLDCFDFLDKCIDSQENGIYCDPPFPDAGEKYKHKFSEADHRRLADRLLKFNRAIVVCRFYDHPLIHELYPVPKWVWESFDGRKQSNTTSQEVLLRKAIQP